MPDYDDLALADPEPLIHPEFAAAVEAVLSDPDGGPYDTYVARAYGRAVASGRMEPVEQDRPYVDDGLIAQPLLGGAAARLDEQQQQTVSAGLGEAITKYLDDALQGQRILGAPPTEVMKHRPPDAAVLMYRGEFTHAGVDLQLSGAGIDFVFRRSYRNQSAYDGPLGSNWDHAYNIRLTEVDQTRLVMMTGSLGEETYVLHSQRGYFVPPPGVDAVFEASGESFLRRAPDGSRHVFARVPGTRYHDLQRIEDRFGNNLTFAHGADEQRLLQRVEVNHPDRFVGFEYDDLGRICAIRDFTGRVWRYCYDDLNDLVAVTSTATSQYPTGLTTLFEYRSALVSNALQHNLTRIIDAEGRMYLENDYGEHPGTLEYNRVVRQRQGSGESHFEYEAVSPISDGPYSDTELPSVQVVHTQRGGHRARHVYNTAGNLLYDERCVTLGGLPRLLQTRYRYNRDGRLISVLSPEGVLTQYLYGRDWFLRRLAITDAEADSHPALTRAERQSFGRVLAFVRRAQTFGVLQLTSAARPWDSFPSVTDTIPDVADIVVKTTYEPEFGQVTTVSHPEFTSSPLPDALNEHPRHVETLTRYEYGGPLARLSRIIQPVPTDADGGAGLQTITQLSEYDTRGRLRELIDADGRVSRFAYFPSALGADATREGHLQVVEIDAQDLRITTRYEVDVLGRVTAVHLPRATGDGRFIERTTYNELDQVLETVQSEPFLYTTRFAYDKTGNPQRRERDLVDSNGNPQHGGVEITTSCYDAEFNLTRETVGGGNLDAHHVTTHCYGSAAERLLTISPAGNRTRYLYDEQLRTVAVTEGADSPEASTIRMKYDGDGRMIGTVDGRGNTTVYRLDAFGRVVEVEDPLGNVTHTTYDKSHNTRLIRSFEPHADGYFLMSRSEDAYDELNRRIRVARSRFENPAGPLARPALADAELSPGPGHLVTTKLFHDAMGRVVRAVDPLDRQTVFKHDAIGRLIVETDPLGNEIHRTYDGHGNVILTEAVDVVRDPATGAEIERFIFPAEARYDELDRRAVTIDGLGNAHQFEYDSRDLVTRVVDPLLNETGTAYDVFGRVSWVTRYLTATGTGPVNATSTPVETSFEYDANDNLTAVTDARGNKTSYRHDQLDRRRAVIYPDGTETSTDYDADDNIIRTQDGNGTQLLYTVDGLGRTTRVDVDASRSLPSVTVLGATFQSYDYDGLGRMLLSRNDHSVTRERYDSLGHSIESTLDVDPSVAGGLGPFTIRRQHDDSGALIELEYPGGRRLAHDRDRLSRLIAVRHLASGADYPGDPILAVGSVIVAIEYAGRLPVRTTHRGGASTDYLYDGVRRVVQILHSSQGQPSLTLQYLYDGAGKVRVRQDDGPTVSERHRFSFDSLYRLVDDTVGPVSPVDFAPFRPLNVEGAPIANRQASMDAQIGGPILPNPLPTFEYDAVGNRTRLRGPRDLAYHISDALDEIAQVVDGSPPVVADFRYDDAGNLVDDGERLYLYDAHNRLTEIRSASGTVTHQMFHDATGRRIAEQVADSTSLLVWDGVNTLVETEDGEVRKHYLHTDATDRPLQLSTAGRELSYHSDLVGSVRVLTQSDGVIAAHYDYTPFGTLEATTQLGGVANSLRFGGRRAEQTLQLYDFRTRTYAPLHGRFLQRDPVGTSTGGNLYLYGAANPLSYRDPYGTDPESTLGEEFSGTLSVGVQFGTHERRVFLEGSVQVLSPSLNVPLLGSVSGEAEASLTTFPFRREWGSGWETDVTVSAGLGDPGKFMAGWSTTWHSAKSWHEMGAPGWARYSSETDLSLTNQRTAEIMLRFGERRGENFTFRLGNDTAYIGGDAGDKFRTAWASLLYTQDPVRSYSPLGDHATATAASFGLKLDLITGAVDKERHANGWYDLAGVPFERLSQGALYGIAAVEHSQWGLKTGGGSVLGAEVTIGGDSEMIRHIFQNRVIHGFLLTELLNSYTPFVPLTDDPARLYFNMKGYLGATGNSSERRH